MTLQVTVQELELLEKALERYRPRDEECQAIEDLLDWTWATLSAAKRVPLGSPTPPPAPLERAEVEAAVAALARYLTTTSKLKAKAAARREAAKDRPAKMLAEIEVTRAEAKHRIVSVLLDRARTLLATAGRPKAPAAPDVASNAPAPRVTSRKHPRAR